MIIELYITTDENIKVDKTLTDKIELNGYFREPSNIINPVINIESQTLPKSNYAYIPEFGRYYFINNITALRNHIFQLELSVDILMSYSTQIKELLVTVGRQEYVYDDYLVDSLLPLDNYEQIETTLLTTDKPFENNYKYVLTVSGGKSSRSTPYISGGSTDKDFNILNRINFQVWGGFYDGDILHYEIKDITNNISLVTGQQTIRVTGESLTSNSFSSYIDFPPNETGVNRQLRIIFKCYDGFNNESTYTSIIYTQAG